MPTGEPPSGRWPVCARGLGSRGCGRGAPGWWNCTAQSGTQQQRGRGPDASSSRFCLYHSEQRQAAGGKQNSTCPEAASAAAESETGQKAGPQCRSRCWGRMSILDSMTPKGPDLSHCCTDSRRQARSPATCSVIQAGACEGLKERRGGVGRRAAWTSWTSMKPRQDLGTTALLPLWDGEVLADGICEPTGSSVNLCGPFNQCCT